MAKRQVLLEALLRALISEWGRDEVTLALSRLSELETNSDNATHRIKAIDGKPKLNFVDRAAKLTSDQSRKPLLVELARQFEQRVFLPTVSDAKIFLEMNGSSAVTPKSREDAFRAVFRLVAEMSDSKIQRLLESDAHRGPSQLGPLADAIRSASGALRGVKDTQSQAHEDQPSFDKKN